MRRQSQPATHPAGSMCREALQLQLYARDNCARLKTMAERYRCIVARSRGGVRARHELQCEYSLILYRSAQGCRPRMHACAAGSATVRGRHITPHHTSCAVLLCLASSLLRRQSCIWRFAFLHGCSYAERRCPSPLPATTLLLSLGESERIGPPRRPRKAVQPED